MESLELRIFREVALEKSISKAAEKMGYVQSNITAHIHNLEEELGTPLFIRHNKGEGEQLLVYANRIIVLLDNAKYQFQKDKPIIKIGSIQTIAADKLPIWLSTYKRSCPNISFSVSTHSQSELIDAVADGTLDCAFINTEFSHPRLTSVFLFREPLTFIAAKSLKKGEIAYQSIIVSNSIGCPYRHLIENWMLKKTSQKPNVIEYDTLEGIIKAVSLGIGISLLPVSVLPDSHDFQLFQSNDIIDVNIQLVTPIDSENPYLIQFIDIVKSYFN